MRISSCTACENHSTCADACDRLAAAIRPDWSTGLKELAIGAAVELVSSTRAHVPDLTPMPELPGLKIVEQKALEYFYVYGYSYAMIAKKLCKKKSYVKITIQRAKKKKKRSHRF